MLHCRIIPSKSSCKVHDCCSSTETIAFIVHMKRCSEKVQSRTAWVCIWWDKEIKWVAAIGAQQRGKGAVLISKRSEQWAAKNCNSCKKDAVVVNKELKRVCSTFACCLVQLSNFLLYSHSVHLLPFLFVFLPLQQQMHCLDPVDNFSIFLCSRCPFMNMSAFDSPLTLPFDQYFMNSIFRRPAVLLIMKSNMSFEQLFLLKTTTSSITEQHFSLKLVRTVPTTCAPEQPAPFPSPQHFTI